MSEFEFKRWRCYQLAWTVDLAASYLNALGSKQGRRANEKT